MKLHEEVFTYPSCDAKGEEDEVNHPPHYNIGKIETIDVITDWNLNYCEGNVIKYLSRYKHKGTPLKDLKKAEWYLKRLIKDVEHGNSQNS